MSNKTEIIGQAAHRVAARAPEIVSGTGAGTSITVWLTEHQTLVTSISGIIGAVVAVLGLAWMIYRDVKRMQREDQ